MFTVGQDGQRTIIETSINTQAEHRKWMFSGLSMKLLTNAAVGVIALVTIADAWNNPTLEKIGLAAAFTTAAGYIFKLGEDAKLDSVPFPVNQTIVLEGDNISIKTNMAGQIRNETYNAKFVELHLNTVPESGISDVVLKYGDRFTPIMLPKGHEEAEAIYDLISKHVATRKKLVKTEPKPRQ